MSTTRPFPAGDCGPEPEGAATAAAGAGSAGAGALGGVTGASVGPSHATTGAEAPGVQGATAQAGPPGAATVRQSGGSVKEEPGKGHPMRQVRRLRLVGVSGAVPRARDFVRQALND